MVLGRMKSGPAQIREVAAERAAIAGHFRDEMVPSARPAVLRKLAGDWPLVRAALQGMQACAELLAQHATDLPVEILRAAPGEQGRFHYSADGASLNFVRGRASLPVFLAALLEEARLSPPHALAVQGVQAERHVPGFSLAHPMELVPSGAEPRLWIGNAAKVATHRDPTDNLAVVAAGRRRFTLFPPSAGPFLYMGPDHPTPAGTPVSMVHVTRPDLERYPLFAKALDLAETAELAPGDAIFIPRDWFHHVEALDPFNILVNYWWDSRGPASA